MYFSDVTKTGETDSIGIERPQSIHGTPLGKWLYPKSEQVAMWLISGGKVTNVFVFKVLSESLSVCVSVCVSLASDSSETIEVIIITMQRFELIWKDCDKCACCLFVCGYSPANRTGSPQGFYKTCTLHKHKSYKHNPKVSPFSIAHKKW